MEEFWYNERRTEIRQIKETEKYNTSADTYYNYKNRRYYSTEIENYRYIGLRI